MLDTTIVKEILSLLKDKTIQKALAVSIVAAISFVGGRYSVPTCDIKGVCQDISDDRDGLSEKLKKARKKCVESKTEALSSLRVELNADCAEKISEAASGSDFDPSVHCAICVARGECSND